MILQMILYQTKGYISGCYLSFTTIRNLIKPLCLKQFSALLLFTRKLCEGGLHGGFIEGFMTSTTNENEVVFVVF